MYVSNQVIDFLEFVFIGALIACIFDFFRGYRKFKSVNTMSVIIQDIIFFIIVTIIIIFSIVKLLDSQIRLYIFLGILIGCAIYFSTISKYIIKLYIIFFNMFKEIINAIFLPVILNIQIFQKIAKKIKKIWEKCCKMFLYMISCICKFSKNKIIVKLKNINKKQKRFKIYEKKNKLRK